jgi:RNA polymerase sigma-70 factor (ECF subfamily)
MAPDSTPPDDALIACIRNPRAGTADVNAARLQLYQRWARRVIAAIARLLPRGEVEDVHHDIWLHVWHRLEAFTGGNFGAWLLTVARNQAKDWLKKKRPEASAALDSQPSPHSSSPLEEMLLREKRERLRHCVERLPPEQRAVVVARLGGAETNLRPEREYKVFYQAKQNLRACLERANP